MLRGLNVITDAEMYGWLNRTVFSGILTNFNMHGLEHERKKARTDRDYMYIKMLCGL